MAIEINITSPGSGVAVTPDGSGNLALTGFARAPGAVPTIEVWLTNANTFDTFRMGATVTAIASAPGFYQWTATFTGLTNLNIPTSSNRFHCAKAILTTQSMTTTNDFITRIAEVHFKGSGFAAMRRRGGKKKKARAS
jgi:hypothetical protein